MERSGNFYKAIQLGYILISILIGCMAYNSLYEWQEIEALELGNKKIDELRKEINNINIQMIKFSLLGETILEWNDKDIEHYHARRMAMDSMLCRFKATYPAERIDSVRSLLEDKERQMFQIVRLMDEQQSINKKIANQIPVIVQKSVQEQSKKPKRKGFLGIFGKKEGTKPTTTTTTLRSSNRNMVNEQKAQSRRLSEQADSLAARNAELNRQLQGLICQIEKKVQDMSFLMSNMAPQEPAFNRGIWKKLEEQVRDWAGQNDSIIIIAGPIYSGGTKKIGAKGVVVPDKFYKIVIDISYPTYKAIAFIIPNVSDQEDFYSFCVSIDQVESLTGLDFFPQYDSNKFIQGLEKTNNTQQW